MVAQHVAPGAKSSKASIASEKEREMQVCAEIANHLIQIHDNADGGQERDVNLNALRGSVAKKYKLKSFPPLTAIIAAVPEHYKKYIVPKLIAKPVRMFLLLPFQVA